MVEQCGAVLGKTIQIVNNSEQSKNKKDGPTKSNAIQKGRKRSSGPDVNLLGKKEERVDLT